MIPKCFRTLFLTHALFPMLYGIQIFYFNMIIAQLEAKSLQRFNLGRFGPFYH